MRQWSESDFVGGHPALDFLNTVADQGKTRSRNHIADWRSFEAWAKASGVLSSSAMRALDTVSPKATGAILTDVHVLRETAHDVLTTLAAGSSPPRDAFSRLQACLKDALGRASLTRHDAGYAWSPDTGKPAWVVDSLALAVEDLLRSADLSRLRECGRCTWLFIDRGRGKGRRWCNMRTCGNRAKAEAFRSR